MIFLIGIIIIISFIIIAIVMFKFYRKYSNIYDSEVIIVLGNIVKDSVIDKRLGSKLDKAAELLKANPASVCIVCGDTYKNFDLSQAYYMKEYLLLNHSIKNKIILEDVSKNTRQNIKYSREIIERRNLNKKVIIVTDNYNQFRAQSYCKKYGLYSYGVVSKYVDLIYPFYCIREIILIIEMFLLINFIKSDDYV